MVLRQKEGAALEVSGRTEAPRTDRQRHTAKPNIGRAFRWELFVISHRMRVLRTNNYFTVVLVLHPRCKCRRAAAVSTGHVPDWQLARVGCDRNRGCQSCLPSYVVDIIPKILRSFRFLHPPLSSRLLFFHFVFFSFLFLVASGSKRLTVGIPQEGPRETPFPVFLRASWPVPV